ncbi:MAG TPA: aspartate aminotransferase family protein [Anaerolineales bacterium]|nr:aspartate aminotransferase family protein [Anaerolineales bacterium]
MTQFRDRQQLLQALAERTPASGKLWNEAQEYVPGGLLSLARKFKPYPFFTARGEGAHIWDVDGNRYIDCSTAYGALLLGHRPEATGEAIAQAAQQSLLYCTPHPGEIEYTRRLIECVPCAERVLLCNSGTEATMQAARLMRAYTGRRRIAKFEGAYHGWHDYSMWSIEPPVESRGPANRPNAVPESDGMPEEIKDTILILPFDEAAFGMIEEFADELAGVMVEPVFGEGSIPVGREFLGSLKEACAAHGVLLMFDEVKTGFRLALGGAQEYWSVVPDLAAYGKIIGGGAPLGAVGSSKAIMDKVTQGDFSVAVAGTFSGNPFSLAVGAANLDYLMKHREIIYPALEQKGKHLRDGFNRHMQARGLPAAMTGVGSFFQTHMRPLPIAKPRDLGGQLVDVLYDMQLFLRYNGVHIAWLHDGFLSTAHSDEIVEEVLGAHIAAADDALRLNGAL